MDGKLRNMTSLYIFKDDKVLLLYRQGSRVVNDMWVGSAGGHFEQEELNDARACVVREMQEEIGLTPDDIYELQLRYVTLRRCNEEIRQNYYFFAKLKDEVDMNLNSNEGISRWFHLSELSSLEMPFTSKHVIDHYLKIGCNNSNLYGGVADGEKINFIKMPEVKLS